MPTKFGTMARTLFVSLIYAAVYGGMQLLLAIIPACNGFADGGIDAAFHEVYSHLFLCTAAAMLAAAALYICFARLRERPISDDVRFTLPKGVLIPAVLLSVGCRLGVCVYTELAQSVPLLSDSMNSFPDYSAAFATPERLVLAVAVMTVLGPIFEEILFRGLIQNELLRGFHPAVAIVLSSLIFSIAHGLLFQSLFTFFVGLALGWCSYRTKGLTCGIAVHIVFNISAFAADYISFKPVLTASAAIVLVIASVIWLSSKTKI